MEGLSFSLSFLVSLGMTHRPFVHVRPSQKDEAGMQSANAGEQISNTFRALLKGGGGGDAWTEGGEGQMAIPGKVKAETD
jgi:hypothetical protein